MPRETYARSLVGESSLEHKLAHTRQAFEDFAYTVAHDLNAPLRSIVSFSQMLEDKYQDALDPRALHYVDLIVENGRKAQARLAGLLQYSRLDTVPLALELTNCNRIVSDCLRQFKETIEDHGTLLHVGLLPQVTADPERLSLLFHCLLSNALKFSIEYPEIDVGVRRGHEAWVFIVRDNGIGIAPRDHESVFTIFHQLHKEAEYPGIGMGLALARHIVEMHGGTIWVESCLGEGCSFCFTLPDDFTQ